MHNSIKHQYELRLSLSTYDYIEVICMIQFVWQNLSYTYYMLVYTW